MARGRKRKPSSRCKSPFITDPSVYSASNDVDSEERQHGDAEIVAEIPPAVRTSSQKHQSDPPQENDGTVSSSDEGSVTKLLRRALNRLEDLEVKMASVSTRSRSNDSRSGRRRKRSSSKDRRYRSVSRSSYRRRRRSSSSSRSRSRSSKRSEFDYKNFLPKGTKVDSFERLALASVKTVRYLHEYGEDLDGILRHLELLCEKAATRVFTYSALVDYDKSVRARADKKGPKAFDLVENADIVRHLSYEGTVGAQKSTRHKHKAKSISINNPCFNFNLGKPCKFEPCAYKHVCQQCGSNSHGSSECKDKNSSK